MNRWMWIVGAPLLVSCAVQNDPTSTTKTGKVDQPLDITAGTRINIEGILDYGTVVFAQNPTTLLEANDFHGYEFDGKAGGVVTITANASSCGAPDTIISLFGPEDANGNRGTSLAENDDAFTSCFLDSQIANYYLPVDGTYLVVVTSFLQEGGGANGHYRLKLTCNNGACALPGSLNFAATRLSQTDIDHGLFTPEDLFEVGDFMFETVYRVENGMGNALTAAPANNTPRPNFRPFPNNVHFAAFGAPEAQTCVSCHNVGGDDGAGDANHNIFQIGDGFNRASGVPRNPPTVLGNGLRQRVGEEMTNDLKAELAAAKSSAASTGVAVTKSLTSKGISFGSLVANPDGTVNFAGVVGVDTDLVVKPFGWKGREALLRRFVEGGFRVHFGMQTQPSVLKHCATPNVNTFGTGANCLDPDADGVQEEITEGQLTAEAIYMGLRETPVRVPAANSTLAARASAGETLFNNIGCASCHRRLMRIANPTHVEPADTTGGAGITVHLGVDNHAPKPAVATDGSMTIEVFSDFKRHDVGAALADSKAFNQIAANQFITPPLWGIADSAPYLHDGRAPTLKDAILQHAGDAATVRANFAALTTDDQSKVVEFLGTLGRIENVGAAKVDLSYFDLEQANAYIDFFIPAGTLVQHGGFLVIARNATRSAFETFYGRTLPSNAVFINAAATGQPFPTINGSETYTLFDTQFVQVDGPTVPEPSTGLQTFSRKNCNTPAGAASSWNVAGSHISTASPGGGVLSSGLGFVCISEFADVGDLGPSGMEFIEVMVE